VTLDALTAPVLDWLADVLESAAPLRSAQLLSGSSSATLYALRPDSGPELVLRLYTKAEWLAEEPDVPLHEAANLRKLVSSGLPVPKLVALDPDGSRCGVPALLMTRLPGRIELTPPDLDDWLRQLAGLLPRLHAISPAGHPWKYAPYTSLSRLAVPAWTRKPALWERAIRFASRPLPPFTPTFIHRDFHPVNVLFENGRLSGWVDWPNACVGPPGVDVAHCRVNLSAMYGLAVADRFLDYCQGAMASYWQYDPIWDLISVLDMDPGPPDVYPPWLDFGLTDLTPALMESRGEEYLASLLARLDQR
jgi:aminoglycoside phosphotransferase (APT) family kinase protein